MNCAAQTLGHSYAKPGRCLKYFGLEATTVKTETKPVRAKLCAHHRRMVKDGKMVELAR